MSAYDRAAGALLAFQAAIDADLAIADTCRELALEALRALHANGESGSWLDMGIATFGDKGWPTTSNAVWSTVLDAKAAVQRLMLTEVRAELLAARTGAVSPSRPASPPPPSGRGDEMALEMGAARDLRDTLPPGSVSWWDDQPTVRC